MPQGSPTPPSSALKSKGLGVKTLVHCNTEKNCHEAAQKDRLDSKVIMQGKYKCKRKIESITEDTMATDMPSEEMVNMPETSFLAPLLQNLQTNSRKCMGFLISSSVQKPAKNDLAKPGGGHLRKAGTG